MRRFGLSSLSRALAPVAGVRRYFGAKNTTIEAVMASPQCWSNVAAADYDNALFGLFCNAFATQLVKRHASAHAELLDVGAGTGAVSIGLAEKYPDARVRPVVVWQPALARFPLHGLPLRQGFS